MVEIGTIGEGEIVVDNTNTAKALCSGALPVYATPNMILLIEKTAFDSMAPQLADGESSVGTYLDIKHVSASPVGMVVHCRTEVIEVDRARVRFSVKVTDSKGDVGTGIHERFIINCDRFMERAQSKLSD